MYDAQQRKPRKVLAIAVAVCAAGAALGPTILLAGKRGGPGPKEPPWLFPSAAMPSGNDTAGGSGTYIGGPAAVVYVDRSCVYCKGELDLWGGMVVADEAGIDVWVVASPRSVMDGAVWVPPSLRGRTVKDSDGSIARALGVNAVPVTFWVDRTDTVRIVGVGRTTRRQLVENTATLRQGEGGS
ncbi:MAG: hypothetical protein OXE96_07745 [Gemmatimonadetes bacterium]|nr:hypothetical protein [Gemmatimonadota bacterium]